MGESHFIGQKGENLAAEFLEEAGYKILHRNWKSGKKEIDIVAENKDFIVFAEVKTRAESYLEPPSGAVSKAKIRALTEAAEWYIKRYAIDKEARFDIVSIIYNGDKFRIDHIENAYYQTLR